jgi:hypothetical protein
MKTLIIIPTYNESENLCPLYWLLPSVRRILLPLLLIIREVPCSCLTLCVIALGTSVQEIGLLCTVEHAFLPHYLR